MLGALEGESAIASASWLLQLQFAAVLLDAAVTVAGILLI
jgi:hypothetical protein